jgi:dTDP-4-amino-4,6-dideoxygalactose transaminase
MKIQMVDLIGQYSQIQNEIDVAISKVINDASFINGPIVEEFSNNLSKYLDDSYVIPCANGTDALQIAMMALDLKPGDEVIVPAFTYVATAEVIGLLRLKPIMVDVDPYLFNISLANIEKAITSKTKAIVPVHLFGQCVDIEPILDFARLNQLYVIEDTAQAIGANYKFSNGSVYHAGTMGDIGCTSFFPSKNLGCFGDGGALYTKNKVLADKIQMISNHGQVKKYIHKFIGVNSRLDSIQAAILNVKLKYLDDYIKARQYAANYYDKHLAQLDWLSTPQRLSSSTHVFHQYTVILDKSVNREKLKKYLEDLQIPSMVYYPIPLHMQEAYKTSGYSKGSFPVSEMLCEQVLSLPMHTELSEEKLEYITTSIHKFQN